jgi:predicted O-methyltransferase YrrM
MNPDTWNAVDRYLTESLVPQDAALEAALASSVAAGLPQIHVAPNQGKLLHVLARAVDARRILEVGTLAGYSTIWLARALAPGGKVVTLEYDAKHADVARTNFERAGLEGAIDMRMGKALDTLAQLAAEGGAPFDFTFIDADKEHNADYVTWALRLSRPGSLIVIDNVVRDGKVADAANTDSAVLGVRRMNELLASEPRLAATAIQTVGSKGYDGFAIAVVLA